MFFFQLQKLVRVGSFLCRSQNCCFKFVAFVKSFPIQSLCFLLLFLNLRGKKLSSVVSKTELNKIKAEFSCMR